MGWVQLCGHRQMLNGFLQAPIFLQYFVAEPVATKESFGILDHHLTERINVHSAYDLNWTRTIALEWENQPYEKHG